jgi:hypothetical protein
MQKSLRRASTVGVLCVISLVATGTWTPVAPTGWEQTLPDRRAAVGSLTTGELWGISLASIVTSVGLYRSKAIHGALWPWRHA